MLIATFPPKCLELLDNSIATSNTLNFPLTSGGNFTWKCHANFFGQKQTFTPISFFHRKKNFSICICNFIYCLTALEILLFTGEPRGFQPMNPFPSAGIPCIRSYDILEYASLCSIDEYLLHNAACPVYLRLVYGTCVWRYTHPRVCPWWLCVWRYTHWGMSHHTQPAAFSGISLAAQTWYCAK